jgi:hypothetical protein
MKAKLLLVLVLISAGLFAEQAPPNEPQYTKEGELIKPENYREWIYLSSGLGMTYGSPIANPDDQDFDNVFVTPQAYKAFLATGTWPDKTMLALEVRFSASKGSINKGGRFQERLAGLEIHLKDEIRFPATNGRSSASTDPRRPPSRWQPTRFVRSATSRTAPSTRRSCSSIRP